jgi:hypothetical protein
MSIYQKSSFVTKRFYDEMIFKGAINFHDYESIRSAIEMFPLLTKELENLLPDNEKPAQQDGMASNYSSQTNQDETSEKQKKRHAQAVNDLPKLIPSLYVRSEEINKIPATPGLVSPQPWPHAYAGPIHEWLSCYINADSIEWDSSIGKFSFLYK